MTWFGLVRRGRIVLAVYAAVALAGGSSAQASVISSTPTLPLLNVPYVSSTSVGCFPAAGVCVSDGTFTLTSLVSSIFNAFGQDIITTVDYTGTLTDLSNNTLGLVQLSGTLEQEVEGRTFSTETGSWTTDLLALSLDGPVLGHTLTLALNSGQSSTGTSSITPLNDDLFKIDSFFDVFVELSLDSVPPLHTTRGPIPVEAIEEPQAVPEPRSFAIMAGPLLALAVMRRRRRAA